MCKLEDPTGTLAGTTWACQHVFYDLLYELPRFTTYCTSARRLEVTEVREEGFERLKPDVVQWKDKDVTLNRVDISTFEMKRDGQNEAELLEFQENERLAQLVCPPVLVGDRAFGITFEPYSQSEDVMQLNLQTFNYSGSENTFGLHQSVHLIMHDTRIPLQRVCDGVMV